MKVSNRFLYYQLVKDISMSTEKMFKLTGQISSGKRLDKPSEDPLGLSTVLMYRSELNASDQYKKSIDLGNGWLSSMDSLLQDTDDLLARASELAVQHASSTSTGELRLGAAEEVKQIRNMVLDHGNAKYGNKYMFGGTMTQNPPFLDVDVTLWQDDVADIAAAPPGAPAAGDRYIDSDDNHIYEYSGTAWIDQGAPAENTPVIVTDTNELYVFHEGEWVTQYQGNDSTFSISISKDNPVEVNIPGNDVFQNGGGNVMLTLMRLEKALRDNDQQGISDQLGNLENSSKILMNRLAKIGAVVNRLDHSKSVHQSSDVSKQERVSNIEDLDYAEAITSLQNQQTIYEAALKSASMITSLSLVDYV